ncbi:MAG TPA: hypothetical protein VFP98_06245, partial [Candidatus Polarisedimenticolia bacterium]|nr:hypothetical protein [Candidatus Polarisedimenticolia bacterium]
DNPSFYYAARVSPAVGFGLRFLPVAALGLVGLVLTLRSASSDPRAALMPLYLLSSNALFLLAHVVSRYRQPMAIALLILGAHALVLFAGSIRSRRYGTTAGLTATLAAAVLILPWNPPPGYGYTRPGEFVIAARIFESRGEPGRAIDELDEAVRAARADPESGHTIPQIVFEKGEILSRAGRHAEAAESFRAVLKLEPRFIGAEEALARELRLGSSDDIPNGTVRPGGQAPR